MKPDFAAAGKDTCALLSAIDYDNLPISDYNKRYIDRLKPALTYYLKIYSCCLAKGLQHSAQSLSGITMVDFGGGSGFLSIYAKKLGVGNVIYVDLNPLSVETVTLLKKKTGVGADVILHGSSDTLAAWCTENGVSPDLLVSTDLIEHVYNLDTLFSELLGINNRMRMVFSTASNPYNPYIRRRLQRMMHECEHGLLEVPNYYAKRKNYIRQRFASFSEQEVEELAMKTRGLIYADIDRVIKEQQSPVPMDSYNTCDPETGNWAERILPVRSYRSILLKYACEVSVYKGFYNINRTRKWKSFVFGFLNLFIRMSGGIGFLLSPFIVLVCDRKENPHKIQNSFFYVVIQIFGVLF
ncbi:MAG: 50S ribosomal protein L11 methyltransferase [Tannerellaceae bacterium]|jgi:predicted nicotinamide N-methyase|nr:50S ribosomal protein L11 methyltransferase [Tannerellaceae bacterium]